MLKLWGESNEILLGEYGFINSFSDLFSFSLSFNFGVNALLVCILDENNLLKLPLDMKLSSNFSDLFNLKLKIINKLIKNH